MKRTQNENEQSNASGFVFQAAAELFSLLSTPVRLRILSVLCNMQVILKKLPKTYSATASFTQNIKTTSSTAA